MLDLRVMLGSGEQVDIEMQSRPHRVLKERFRLAELDQKICKVLRSLFKLRTDYERFAWPCRTRQGGTLLVVPTDRRLRQVGAS